MKKCESSGGVIKVRKSTGDEVSNRCYILELPDPVSDEIFFRLPIKAIMRSKCVCTSWYNLISKPNFSVCYSRKSYIKPLLNFPASENPDLVDLLEISEKRVCAQSIINPGLPSQFAEFRRFSFIGLCNGLLCYLDHKPRFDIVNVINPIMGNPVALPELERICCNGRTVQYHFGFNASGNNYKVVRIVCKVLQGSLRFGEIEDCKIFTIGLDDQWRRFSMSFADWQAFASVISFGGAFNWIPCRIQFLDILSYAYREAGKLGVFCRPDVEISTFDLDRETLGSVPGPQGLDLHYMNTPLTIYDGRLSVVDFTDVSEVTVWTMEKYADAGSWTKFVVLAEWMPPGVHGWYWPISKFEDGEILFVSSSGGELVSCNIEDESAYQIGVREFSGGWTLYAPSFFLRADKMVREDAGRA